MGSLLFRADTLNQMWHIHLSKKDKCFECLHLLSQTDTTPPAHSSFWLEGFDQITLLNYEENKLFLKVFLGIKHKPYQLKVMAEKWTVHSDCWGRCLLRFSMV